MTKSRLSRECYPNCQLREAESRENNLGTRLQTLNSNYTRFSEKNQVKNHHSVGLKYHGNHLIYMIDYTHTGNSSSMMFFQQRQSIYVKNLYYN